jgi:hypothetical protein
MPVLYRGLYRLAAVFGGSVTLSKLLPYLLLTVTVWAVGRTAFRLSGRIAAVTAICAVLGHHVYLLRMSGGLPRSFAFPVSALVCSCLVSGNVWMLSLLTIISAGFYPVVSVIAGGCLGVWLFVLPRHSRGEALKWSLPRRMLTLGLTALGSVAVLLPQSLASRKYGGLISVDRLVEFPEIGPLGRYIPEDRAPFAPLLSAWRDATHATFFGPAVPVSASARALALRWSALDENALTELLVLVALVYWAVMLRSSRALRRLSILPLVVGGAYWMSARHAPFFFLPQRYLAYTTPVLCVIVVAAAVGAIAQVVPQRFRFLGMVASCGLSMALLLVAVGRGSPAAGLHTHLPVRDPVLLAIARLPKDALVAAWPTGVTNDIPYMTKRAVLVSHETHQAFHVEYALTMRRRVNALIEAFSATTPQPLLRLHRDFGVTHVVYQDEFVAPNRPRYFRPFDKEIERARTRLGTKTPLLGAVGEPFVVSRHGRRTLISLERLAASFDVAAASSGGSDVRGPE